MDAQHRGIRGGADQEAGGDHDHVVHGLGVDVLDAVDALDDRFERFGDQLLGVIGAQTRRLDDDIDHGNGDLRLFLTRQGKQRDEAEGEGCDQEEWCQRRFDEGTGEIAGNAQIGHLGIVVGRARFRGLVTGIAHFVTTMSPAARPDRISMFGTPSIWMASPVTTARSTTASPSLTATKSMPARLVRLFSGTSSAWRTPTGVRREPVLRRSRCRGLPLRRRQ